MNSDGYTTRIAGAAVAIGLGAAVATGQPVASATPDGTQQDSAQNPAKDDDHPKPRIDHGPRSPLKSITKSLENSRKSLERGLGIGAQHRAPKDDADAPDPGLSKKPVKIIDLDADHPIITVDIPKILRNPKLGNRPFSPALKVGQDALTKDLSELPKLSPADLAPQVKFDRLPSFASVLQPPPLDLGPGVITSAAKQFALVTGTPSAPAATSFIAPATPAPAVQTNLTQRVFGIFGSSSSLLPGQNPTGDNPLGWAVLAWARRQFQKTPIGHVLLNSAPVATTPVDMVGNTVTINATDPDADKLTYTVTQPANGTVVQDPNDPSKFTYTGEGNETFTVTVSDADSGYHFHGLQGLFAPDGGHTKTVVVNVPAQEVHSTPPVITDVDIDPGSGYTATGSPFVGNNNTAVQYATGGTAENPTYALAIRGSDGNTKVVDLEGKPVDGQNPLITDTAVIQNIQRTDGSYAMVVVPTNSPAPQARSIAPAAFSSAAAPQDSYTVNLDGKPAGFAIAGQDGIVYQTVDPNNATDPNTICNNCRIAVVDTTRVSEAGYTPDVVDIPGTITPGFSTIGGTKYTALSVDDSGKLYVNVANSTQPAKVWIIDPATVDPNAPNDGATVLALNGFTSPVQSVAIGPDGKGYIGTTNTTTGKSQLEIIDPTTQSVVSTVALPEGQTGLVTFANGNVYQQAFVVDYSDPDHPTIQTVVYVIPQGGGTPQEIKYPGTANVGYGWPVAAADGTVYQSMVAGPADRRR